jgi:CheY-like chemotaxis protein
MDWKALVVEDEADSAKMFTKILSFAGISYQHALNGVECLKMIDQGYLPDIVIMDLSMPELDGWQTLIRLRSNIETAHIPVVAVTAYYSDEVDRHAYQVGFDAYYHKPVDPRTFVEEIRHLVV